MSSSSSSVSSQATKSTSTKRTKTETINRQIANLEEKIQKEVNHYNTLYEEVVPIENSLRQHEKELNSVENEMKENEYTINQWTILLEKARKQKEFHRIRKQFTNSEWKTKQLLAYLKHLNNIGMDVE